MRIINELNASAMLGMQRRQYAEKLLLADTVPAGGQRLGRTAVSNLGHFLCLQVTGKFETVENMAVGGVPQNIDTGFDYLRGQMIDGAGQKKLFTDFVPFSLWLSPGRVRVGAAAGAAVTNALGPIFVGGVLTVDTSAPSNALFYPTEFEYLFMANSEIQLDVRNASNIALSYEICFHGVRVLSSAAVSNL